MERSKRGFNRRLKYGEILSFCSFFCFCPRSFNTSVRLNFLFWKNKVNVEDYTDLLKTKAKILVKLKKDTDKKISVINSSVPGIVVKKIRDLSILISRKNNTSDKKGITR